MIMVTAASVFFFGVAVLIFLMFALLSLLFAALIRFKEVEFCLTNSTAFVN